MFESIIAAAALIAAGPAAARGDSVAAIRAQRAAFNRAIAAHDTAAIANFLSDNVQMVRGSNSEVISGKAAQLAFWAPSATAIGCIRTTGHIDLSHVAAMALEAGHWRCATPAGRANWASGRYVAKWRRIQGAWRIESETFMTVDCAGTLCPNR